MKLYPEAFAHEDATSIVRCTTSIFSTTKTEDWTFKPFYAGYEPDYIEKYYRYYDPDGRRWLTRQPDSPSSRTARYRTVLWR